MQIQNVQQHQPNFNGKVSIVGTLSYAPARAFEMISDDLSKFLEKKSCDLFIKENKNDNNIIFTVKNSETSKKSLLNNVFCKTELSTDYGNSAFDIHKLAKLYKDTAQTSVNDYEIMKQSFSTSKIRQRIAKYFEKITNAIWKIFSDSDEV